jgi:uncharacterized protein (DUF433 family)
MLKSKKITIDEITEFFPELQEDDIKELNDEMKNSV